MSFILHHRRKNFRPDGMLDKYAGSAAAFSLRELTDTWVGKPVVNVERGGPNSGIADFTAEEIIDGTLSDWVDAGGSSTGDGTIRIWYDQSGNGFDISFLTSSSQQPKIISNSSNLLVNSNPTVKFDGTNYLFNSNSLSYDGGVSWYAVIKSLNNAAQRIWGDDIVGVQGNCVFLTNGTAEDYRINDNGNGYNQLSFTGETPFQQIRSFHFDESNGNYEYAFDGSNTTGTAPGWTGPIAPSGSTNVGVGGAGNGGQYLNGDIQELIIYPNNMNSYRTGIEENISEVYSNPIISTNTIDEFPNTAAAYSLRELTDTWSGQPVISVRRGGDNAISDFTAEEITNGTIITWSSAGDGNAYVTIWKDQSGNSFDISQSDPASQPQIVSSGALIQSGSKPAIDFNGTSHYLINAGSLTYTSGVSWYAVIDTDVNDAQDRIWCDDIVGAQGFVNFYSNGSFSINNGSGYKTATLVSLSETPNQEIRSFNFNSSTGRANGSINLENTDLSSVSGWNNLPISTSSAANVGVGGAGNGGQHLDGKLQELIVYTSNKGAQRSFIVDNINSYYSIY